MKKTRRMGGDDELNITSMMDMMTIILVFLLKSVGASEVEVRTSDQLKLPYSTNKAPPLLTVSVVVQKDSILVDGAEVASVISETNPNLSNVRTYAVPKDEKTGL
jgi:biopolymer transport protein ExbD